MLQIRPATPADVEAISRLLIALTREHIAVDCTAAGLDTLLHSMRPEAVLERLNANYVTWVAIESDRLAGVCSLRLPSHVFHLFVAAEIRKQGVGRALLQTAVQHCLETDPGIAALTLNASSFAIPAYLKMGFVMDGPAQEANGVRSQPARLPLVSSGSRR